MSSHPITCRLVLWLLLALMPAWATATEATFRVAAGFMQVDYREYDKNDHELNREYGILPGIELGFGLHGQRWFFDSHLSAFADNVSYDGQTQQGVPHSTLTQTQFHAASLQLGGWFNQQQTWGAFAHLAGQQWHRDILPDAHVQGIFERYRWLETGAGIIHQWRKPQPARWGQQTRLAVFATTQGKLDVHLSKLQGQMPDVVLHPRSSAGLRITHQSNWMLTDRHQLFIQPQLAWWHFQQSRTVTVFDGVKRLYVHEPRSTTWRIGLMAGVQF